MRFIFILISLFFSLNFSAQAQDSDVYVQPFDHFARDTTEIHNQILYTPFQTTIVTDSLIHSSEESNLSEETEFKPDAEKVLWLGAVIPGFGQIVNRQYWKLPIVYGGFIGCGFAISWFSKDYEFYRMAYRDMLDTNPAARSHLDYLEAQGLTMADYRGEQGYTNYLQARRDNFRRYRDWSIVISILYYGAVILEGYVAAQLFDFDISPDLSMNIQPAIINNDVLQTRSLNEYNAFAQQTRTLGNSNAIGIQWNIRF